MQISKIKSAVLFKEVGFDDVKEWSLKTHQARLDALMKVVNKPEEFDPSEFENEQAKKIGAQLQKAGKAGEAIEVVEASDDHDAEEAKPAKKKAKPAKDEAEEEESEEEETEADEEESEEEEPDAEEEEEESEEEAEEEEAEEEAPKPKKKKILPKASKEAAKPAKKVKKAKTEDEADAETEDEDAKPAKKAKVKRERGSGKKNAFGAFINSQNGKIDACLGKKPKTVSEITEESGEPTKSVGWRVWILKRKKLITHHGREGYSLKVKKS